MNLSGRLLTQNETEVSVLRLKYLLAISPSDPEMIVIAQNLNDDYSLGEYKFSK